MGFRPRGLGLIYVSIIYIYIYIGFRAKRQTFERLLRMEQGMGSKVKALLSSAMPNPQASDSRS